MRKSKIIIKSIALALAVVCSLSLVSCSKNLFKGVESSEEDLRVVGKVGKYEVCYDELYYLIMSCKDIMKAKHGADIFKTEASAAKYADELHNMVMERITVNYAVFILSEEYGLEEPLKNKDIVDGVNAQIDATLYELAVYNGISVEIDESLTGEVTYKYEKGGEKKARQIFKEALEDTYLTERVMRLTLAAELAFNELPGTLSGKSDIIYSDADIEQFMFSDEFVCIKRIVVNGTSEESLAKAEAALAALDAGASMDDIIAGKNGYKFNDDVTSTPEGYYFAREELTDDIAAAVYGLKVGEISGIIKADTGYLIIQRCEKSSSYMLSNLSTFAQQIIAAQINTKLSEYQQSFPLVLSEFGSSLEFYKIAVAEENKGDNK